MKKKVQKESNIIKDGDIIISRQKKFFGLFKVTEIGIVIEDQVLVFDGLFSKAYKLSSFLEKGINTVYTPKKYYSKAEQSVLSNSKLFGLYKKLNDVINNIRPNTIGENEPIESNKYYKPVIFS